MKRTITLLLLIAVFIIPAKGQDVQNVKQVKNVILLIPDGTSLATVSTARWLQWYTNPSKPKLNLDPYLCGTVRTLCSNEPIGDSAPTTSCYMTGYTSRAGWVSTYPLADPQNDIYPNDPKMAYQPLTTVLEAAKMLYGKSTGLVFTCEFPHATPADCASHSYNRSRYDWIAPQMVHNDLNVVIGGGAGILNTEEEAYLKGNGYGVFKNDISGMRSYAGNNMWALYCDHEMAYDIDRDTTKEPALEEMTRIAIDKLSKNPQGFFLMVEGSKVDWAAHANDPVGMATDMLAYDRACGVALDFARRNGETAVIMVPDHGNSGISIGSRRAGGHGTTKDVMFKQFSQIKLTADGFAAKVNSVPNSEVQNVFRTYAGFELTQDELNALNNCKDYKNSPIPADKRSADNVKATLYSGSLTSFMANLITSKTCFGFTTNGHTGEEVFLAAYHPQNTLPLGMLTNIELNHYMCNLYGFNHDKLDELTKENFAPYTEVFKDYKCTIIPAKDEKSAPTLVVVNKKKQMNITPNTNIVTLGKKGKETIRLNSVIIYVDKNNTFYLPVKLADYLK